MDFFILTVPRSGSYMLASALNAHSQITCRGEIGMLDKFPMPDTGGEIEGCIIQSYRVPSKVVGNNKTKILLLLRDPEDIIKSRYVDSPNGDCSKHYLKPTSVKAEIKLYDRSDVFAMQDEIDKVTRYARGRDVLRVDYENLTGNRDMRVLNLSDEICDFLGVDREPLRPQTYKPMVSI